MSAPDSCPTLAKGAQSCWILRDGFVQDEGWARLRMGHGLTTRASGDARSRVLRRAALGRAGAPESDVRMLKQVHGTDIIYLPRSGPGHNAIGEDFRRGTLPQADGWITERPGAVVGVHVADCLPIFIRNRSATAAGVFHSGWRGLAAGMPARAVAAFSGFCGIAAEDLVVSIGPHVGACCYRIGLDISGRFRAESLVCRGSDCRLDLGAEALAQFAKAGVPKEAVTVSSDCTACRSELLYSFRREGNGCGSMLAFLWLAP